jgi:hypothetical protein
VLMPLPVSRVALALTALIAVAVLVLRWMAHWGATSEELAATLPGDELVPHPDLTTTRAVTINARAADVWPWIAQLGQGRGGFYSYDALENLVGCDIHSTDRIVPAWQSVPVGAQVRLAPEVAMTVAVAEPGHALVLRGGIPMGSVAVVRLHLGVRAARGTRQNHPAGLPRTLPQPAVVGRTDRRADIGDQLRDEPQDAPRDRRAGRTLRRTTDYSTEGPVDELGLEAYRPHTEQFGPLQRTGIWRPVPALLDGAGRKPGDEENLRPRATRMWCHS